MAGFVGRADQLTALRNELSKVTKQLRDAEPGRCLLIRGRRRVGKSRLVEEFLDRARVPSMFFTASRQASDELGLFADAIRESDLPGRDAAVGVEPQAWDGALRLLDAALPQDGPAVVVVDEFPYLVEEDESVEAVFQKHWDRSLAKKPVLLLLIGSDLAMMETLNTHGRAFYQRGSELVIPPLSPSETATIVGSTTEADAFDAYLVTGGLPLICADWSPGQDLWEFLGEALSQTTSPLIVSAERSLAAEFPEDALARHVLNQIGSGEVTFTNIARAAGGLRATSLHRGLELLTNKRVVVRELPTSTKTSKEARYRVVDPYLRFWLTFIGPGMAEIERGRNDRVLARIERDWTGWRGRAIEPVVRESINRLLPIDGLPPAQAVGAYWTRTNVPEIDLIGADRLPQARKISFAGTIKWLENAPLDQGDLNALTAVVGQVPGADEDTPLVAVSRSGVTAAGAACELGPEDLLAAW